MNQEIEDQRGETVVITKPRTLVYRAQCFGG